MKPGEPGSPEHALLHCLWSKAVDSPGYDKEEWKALEKMFQGRALAFVCYNCGVESKAPAPKSLAERMAEIGRPDVYGPRVPK